MEAELVVIMKQAGTTAIGKITPDLVRRRERMKLDKGAGNQVA